MKLAKDTFKKNEVEAAAAHIKDLIWDFIEEKKMYANITQYSPNTINLTTRNVNYQGQNPIANFKSFYQQQYHLFDNTTNKASHKLNIEYNLQDSFYLNIFNKLNKFEKILFIKNFASQSQSYHFFSKISPKLSEEDFWLHLRHIAPFEKGSQSATDVRDVLKTLDDKSIDTKEKRESLAYYIHYYKTLCKRTDIQSGLKKLILKKIDEEHIPFFEQLLKTQISSSNTVDSILENPPQIQTFIINKEKMFSELSLDNISQAETHHYNRFINNLNYFLVSEQTKERLGIERIDFIEFKSTKEPGRVFIQSSQEGFKEEIRPIYLHLLATGAKNFQLNNSTSMSDVFEKSLNYYLLNQKIPNKHQNEENTPKKSFKI